MESSGKILDVEGNELAVGDTVLLECTVSQLLPLEDGLNLRVLVKSSDGTQLQIALSAEHVRKAT